MEEDPSGKLSEFVADLKFEDIPEEHLDYAKKDILDGIGCFIAGTTGPTIKEVMDHVRAFGGAAEKGCRIPVYGDRLPVAMAAFANGTIARACDLGDTHNEGGHIVEWVLPTLLTGIDMTDEKKSGKDFLTSFVAGAEWGSSEQVTMKPYAGCKYNHTPIYGMLKLMKKEGFTWQDIESAHFTVSKGAIVTIDPPAVKWNPQTPAEALFSNPYSVAYALIHGDCFLDAYEADEVMKNMADPVFTELMGRLHYTQDFSLPVFDDYPIEVTLRDGRTFKVIERELAGNIINPMSWEEVEHKFWNCTRYAAVDLGEEKYKKIIDLCRRMEEIDDISVLMDALV